MEILSGECQLDEVFLCGGLLLSVCTIYTDFVRTTCVLSEVLDVTQYMTSTILTDEIAEVRA